MKKRLLSVLLIMCILGALLPIHLSASNDTVITEQEKVFVAATVDGEQIKSVQIDEVPYLFLPSSASLTNLQLAFDGVKVESLQGAKGKCAFKEQVNISRLAYVDKNGRYAIKASTSQGDIEFYIMKGAAISTVYISSGDVAQPREWVDQSKKNKSTGFMKLVQENGTIIYDGELTQIKPRGNSTFDYYPKKAYQIKLGEKTDLLKNGEKEKTWALLANYGDATLMHDKLMKDLAARLGMPYVASSDWVNLYYDGEYRGVYLLGEKNSVGGNSVDITDLEDAYSALNENYGDDMIIAESTNTYGQKYFYTTNLVEPETTAGGWLIELNLQNVDEASGFYTRKGNGVNVKSPEWQ